MTKAANTSHLLCTSWTLCAEAPGRRVILAPTTLLESTVETSELASHPGDDVDLSGILDVLSWLVRGLLCLG